MKSPIFFTLVFCILSGIVVSNAAAKTAVVISRKLPPFEEAWSGFQEMFGGTIDKFYLEGSNDNGRTLMESCQGYDLVVSIGSEAALAARKFLKRAPVVYTMVLEKQDFGSLPASGVLMQMDITDQIEKLSRLLPQATRWGVLYTNRSSAAAVKQARQFMESRNMSLEALAVDQESDIPKALDKLARRNINFFWSVVDPVTSKPEAIRQMIDFANKHKIPFAGLSRNHVQAGALLAFSIDYKSLGMQTAEVGHRLLTKNQSLPPEYPQRLVLYVSQNAQKNLGIPGFQRICGIGIVEE